MAEKMEENLSPRREINKGDWTAEEDRKLAEVIAVHSPKRWKSIAIKEGEQSRVVIDKEWLEGQEDDRWYYLLGKLLSQRAVNVEAVIRAETPNGWSSRFEGTVQSGAKAGSSQ
ncbi:hypothetical protein CCACVL1_21677 [Corchorus capsularis]|uniref:Uncharacterized protein n=1 Tax=Corchorus capsularis TaxID=210143 RepID=A0A1R3H2H7_COCAP|nr:hypothetical protein CCACVL1_21677 [Corchorus capsularis]